MIQLGRRRSQAFGHRLTPNLAARVAARSPRSAHRIAEIGCKNCGDTKELCAARAPRICERQPPPHVGHDFFSSSSNGVTASITFFLEGCRRFFGAGRFFGARDRRSARRQRASGRDQEADPTVRLGFPGRFPLCCASLLYGRSAAVTRRRSVDDGRLSASSLRNSISRLHAVSWASS